jgi:hypothetical protein
MIPRALWLSRLFLVALSVGAVSCSPVSGNDEQPADGEHAPPNFRRVRLFNASDFKVKSVEVKIKKPAPEKDLGKLIENVEPHRVGSADAGSNGFASGGGTAGAAVELEIAIVMLDAEDMDRILPPYTVDVAQPGYKMGDVLICIENHEDPNTWNVTTCSFSHSDELQALARHPPLPAPVAMSAP